MKKKASLRLFCNDLFQTAMIDPYVRFKGQNLSADYSCYRTFGLAFTYKFGGYKEKQRKEADTSRFWYNVIALHLVSFPEMIAGKEQNKKAQKI